MIVAYIADFYEMANEIYIMVGFLLLFLSVILYVKKTHRCLATITGIACYGMIIGFIISGTLILSFPFIIAFFVCVIYSIRLHRKEQ